MENPRDLARVLARALRETGGLPPPQPPAPRTTTAGPEDEAWRKWFGQLEERFTTINEGLEAVDFLFGHFEQRVLKLENKIAELEKRTTNRAVEHIRDGSGSILRSVLVETDG